MMNTERRVQTIEVGFPLALVRPGLEWDSYEALRREWPKSSMFDAIPIGNKTCFNNRRAEWKEFVRNSPACKEFEKGVATIAQLAMSTIKYHFEYHFIQIEFSALPADGGWIRPHPDTPNKVLTAVIYTPDDDWRPEWGGAFEALRKNHECADELPAWTDVETILSVPYEPNTMIMMAPNKQSFHGVRPLTGPVGRFRKSITVNFLGSISQ